MSTQPRAFVHMSRDVAGHSVGIASNVSHASVTMRASDTGETK